MKLFKNPVFWAAVIAVFVIAITGLITGTYYGTRLPLEMRTHQKTPAKSYIIWADLRF